MTIAEEISSVWGQIAKLDSNLRWSRNKAERKELKRNIDSLHNRLRILQLGLDADPCQTPGSDNEADLEPNRCVKCADQEVDDGN